MKTWEFLHMCRVVCKPRKDLTDIKAYQALLSMRFPGKGTGVGGHFLLQQICWLRDGTASPLADRFFTTKPPGKSTVMNICIYLHYILRHTVLIRIALIVVLSRKTSTVNLSSGSIVHWWVGQMSPDLMFTTARNQKFFFPPRTERSEISLFSRIFFFFFFSH